MTKIPHYDRELLEQITLTSKQIMIVETYLQLSNKIGVADITIQKLADEMIDRLQFNMKGTKLFEPLRDAYKIIDESKKKYGRIFLITDGVAWQFPEATLNMVERRKNNVRLHVLGLGTDVD